MDIPAAPAEAASARPVSMKFTYASGSRPLDGYTIKRGVGRGGFGEVYYGTSDGGKEVALKLIRRNLEVELRGVRHCLNLKHPHLVALFDIRTDEHDDRWVVMEYVSGESLEDAIEKNPHGMPEAEALRWMRGICAGVAYLHDQGIVHRDLKPGNIFSDEGVVKIGDYGLSKFISCSRRSGQTESVGTVHYMAPEIANGRYGKEIDTYALGVILYEMLTGRVPFEGESVGEVLMKHLTAEPDLSILKAPYRTIVERALAKDPQRRFDSVHELAAMLPPDNAAPAYMPGPLPEARPPRDFAPSRGAADIPIHKAAERLEAASYQSTGDEEPIWAAVRTGWHNLMQNWAEAEIPGPLRIVIIVGAVVLLVTSFTIWAPLLFTAFIIYCVYWVIRAVFIVPGKRRALGSNPPSPGPARAAQAPPRRHDLAVTQVRTPPVAPEQRPQPSPSDRKRQQSHRRRQHRRSLRAELTRIVAQKSMRERVTELTGSMLVATLVAAVASGGILLLMSGEVRPEHFAWVFFVGTLGSWLVMIPAKFYEGKVEDHSPKRFTQLLLGLLLGLAAWGLADTLMLELPFSDDLNFRDPLVGELMNIPRNTFHSGSHVPLAMFAGYFGFLLLILRWWTQAEWTRYTRLSIWAIAVCITMAYVLHMFWWFPQPAGLMVTTVMALSIQLSSPWLSMSRRREIMQKLHTT